MIPYSWQLTTSAESRTLDEKTINEFGIDGYTLMEIAGYSMAMNIIDSLDEPKHGLICCGKGNNGGDGLVVARYLSEHFHNLTIVFVSGSEDLSPNAQKNAELLQKLKKRGEAPITFIEGWNTEALASNYDFIIDAMLGTGLDSKLHGDYPEAVEWINSSGAPVFAVDVPTGLNGDTGEVLGSAVIADRTFNFGSRKLGCYLGRGPEYSGGITYCELPFPNYLKKSHNRYLMDVSWIENISLMSNTQPKPRHKYEAGVLYIVAGSEGLTGAAIMAARSAWAEGVGAVILLVPRGLLPVLESQSPQIIKKPVGSHGDYFFKESHLDEVRQVISEKEGAVLIGPGLGRASSTIEFVQQFVTKISNPTIIDADGLFALSQMDWPSEPPDTVILTPHPGELRRLIQPETDISFDYKRLTAVEQYCQEKKVHLISKGYPGIVATPQKISYITGYDTRIFSRAGFGDVLAGKIGAYLSWHLEPEYCGLKALMDGYKKSRTMVNKPLEPLDLV